ncbi:hypothetical protein ElyMa_003101300 [Elysia marginata]|uniref:Transmembrane protein n=1 Tax=Elysia marginata TaxID=1093978 RepID=A0AAV4IRX1_9GAST|nr:hypothetical protein ElyMa_003101300 [Elysia marginata]
MNLTDNTCSLRSELLGKCFRKLERLVVGVVFVIVIAAAATTAVVVVVVAAVVVVVAVVEVFIVGVGEGGRGKATIVVM